MATLNKKLFKSLSNDLFKVKTERLEVAEGYEVNIIQLTAQAAIDLSKSGAEDEESAIFAWTAACVVDDDFKSIFTVEDIRKMPQAMVRPMTEAVVRLNGLLNTDTTEAAEKN